MNPADADRGTGPVLTAELEDLANAILLGPPDAVDAKYAALCAAHEGHRRALERLRADFERAAGLFQEPAESVTAPLPPPIGQYRFVRQIGEGGFGIVFLAEQDEPIRRSVAIKLMHPRVYSKNAIARFLNERETLARMDHPSIGRIFDAGVDAQGNPYFVMEFVPGEPLHTFVNRCGPSLTERIEVFLEACAAITHAHQRGVIHRDLKPHNILVTSSDGKIVPKVIDFGLAKVLVEASGRGTANTGVGVVLGTPAYMSPEQLRGNTHDLDVRTDVYSLGVILYEVLAGVRPFGPDHYRASTLAELQKRLDADEPPLASARAAEAHLPHASRLRGDLDWILLKAMAKQRDERYASVAEFAADLRRHLAHEPVLAGPPSVLYVVRKFVRRHRVPVMAAAIVLLALVLGLVISAQHYRQAQASEQLAKASLRNFWRLADLVELEELVEEERNLWPSSPGLAADHERWLVRARALVGRRPIHARTVQELAARLSDASIAWSGPEEEQGARFMVKSLDKLIGNLDELDGEQGQLRSVARRAEFARSVADRTITRARAKWDRVIASVASSPRYGGLRLQPIVGLVPLGPDKSSGLEEFAHAQSGEIPARAADGRLAIADDTAIVLVLIPGGTYVVGSQSESPNKPHYDPHRSPVETNVRKVRIEAFLIGKFELTQGQARALEMPAQSTVKVGASAGGGRKVTAAHPEETMLAPVAVQCLGHFECRLPTVFEWEVAARGGSTQPWIFGDEPQALQGYANVADATVAEDKDLASRPSDGRVRDGHLMHAPVGTFLPNPFGLHDVLGNVSELTWGEVKFAGEPHYVARGGSFMMRPIDSRIGSLRVAMPNQTTPEIGLRVARSLTRD